MIYLAAAAHALRNSVPRAATPRRAVESRREASRAVLDPAEDEELCEVLAEDARFRPQREVP